MGEPTKAAAPRQELFWNQSHVTVTERAARNGHPGLVVWLTGLSASGKSTIATALERRLFSEGRQVFLLDGDNLRQGLNAGLTFSGADRTENIRRAGEAAKLLAEAGLIVITALISPFAADRARARSIMPPGRFFEVFVNAPLSVCQARDPKGLYARVARGEIREFTGVSSPYEAPTAPDLELRTDALSPLEAMEKLHAFVLARLH